MYNHFIWLTRRPQRPSAPDSASPSRSPGSRGPWVNWIACAQVCAVRRPFCCCCCSTCCCSTCCCCCCRCSWSCCCCCACSCCCCCCSCCSCLGLSSSLEPHLMRLLLPLLSPVCLSLFACFRFKLFCFLFFLFYLFYCCCCCCSSRCLFLKTFKLLLIKNIWKFPFPSALLMLLLLLVLPLLTALPTADCRLLTALLIDLTSGFLSVLVVLVVVVALAAAACVDCSFQWF